MTEILHPRLRLSDIMHDLKAAVRDITPHGRNEREFGIRWTLNGLTSEIVAAIDAHPDIEIISAGKDAMVVHIPESWVTDYNNQLAAALGKSPTVQPPAKGINDSALSATALEIKRLQQKIDDLEAQHAQAIDRAENAEGERDTLREQNRAYNTLLVDTVAAPKCKEVCTKRDVTDADFQRFLNDGWETLHIQFESGALNVVFVREVPAPEQERPVQMVTVIPNTAMAITAVPAAASPRFNQMVIESDARLNTLAPFSPVTQAFVDYMDGMQS